MLKIILEDCELTIEDDGSLIIYYPGLDRGTFCFDKNEVEQIKKLLNNESN